MIKKRWLILSALAMVAGIMTGCGSNKMEIKDYHTDTFGENVYIFTPDDDAAGIQNTLDNIYKVQETAQFDDNRVALYFMPGTYDVSADVGFYTQLSGLGVLPTDTKLAAANTYARWLANPMGLHNATCNFWRSIENMEMQSDTVWAVSQATGMRRVQVDGNLTLHDDYGWASGGFLADSKVTGLVDSGTQQQWLSRNNSYSSWLGQNWNIVMLGDEKEGVPTKTWPESSYTAVEETKIIREKPFLVYDKKDGFGIYVPDWKKDSSSLGWESDTPEGKVLPLKDFYVAKDNVDTAATINQALSDGKNILFTPGIYELNEAITV